jgi:hypothetical protein
MSEIFSGVDQALIKHLSRTQIKAWSTLENISDVCRKKPGLLQKTYLRYADKNLAFSRKHL